MIRRRFPSGLSGEPPPTWLGLLATVAIVAVGTAIVYPLKSVAPVVSLGVVYLPGILLISIVWGLRLGLLASVASALAYNFFQLPPLHRLTISEEGNWVALLIFVIVAAISSAVAELARAQAVEAERGREEADRALTELSLERDRKQAEMVEAEALRRSDELKTALLRSISHDLRTPLTSMIASGAALGSTSATAQERAELSEAIVAEGERLSRLVENLIDMSRLEAGKAEPRREAIDLAEVLDAARDAMARPEVVRLEVARDLPLVEADAAQLERAFANLLENAVRHGGGRPVLVKSRLVADKITVRVVDQGAGIPQSEWQRIFEPFQHGVTNGAAGGAGLGLAIAKGFVEANGGEIAVDSVPGQGSSFVVSMPAREALL